MKTSKVTYIIFQVIAVIIGGMIITVAYLSMSKSKCKCGKMEAPAQSGTSCDKIADPDLKRCCNSHSNIVWFSGCPAGVIDMLGKRSQSNLNSPCTGLSCVKYTTRKGPLALYFVIGAVIILLPSVIYWPIALKKKKNLAKSPSPGNIENK